MKKIISIVLILIMCLGLYACDGSEAPDDDQTERDQSSSKNEILGEWTLFEYGISVTFLKDGTGTDNGGSIFTWKYNEDLKYYTIAVQTEDGVSTFDTMIQKTKNPAVTYITVNGERFYHISKHSLKDCKVITVKAAAMSPIINNNDTVLCSPIRDSAKVSIGDIIVFWTVVNGSRVVRASRVKNIYNGDGFLVFETQGDNNESADPLTVHENEILGEFVEVLS